ncbi:MULTISPECIES: allophanate hydrolase-related protein [Amycolatopsis]|uniref:allophanate hydrolase-related protein n=1 Tax=Amycolatopsis TaxID=1813 RepID=UPI0031F8CB4C
METLPLPPEPAPLPPAPVTAHRQVLAAYDRIAEVARPELWCTLRPCEEVLIDAKAVDERVRAGESLPLAGLLAVGAALDGLTEAGAVVLGDAADDQCGELVGLDIADIAIGAGRAAPPDVVVVTPTAGLAPQRISVFARTVEDAQRTLRAITTRPWPASVRLSAGEHPRIAVPAGVAKTTGDLLAWGAVVERGHALAGHDALVAPPGLLEPHAPPSVRVPAADVFAAPFDDQVALDIAAFLHGEQLREPCADTGTDVVVFGTHLRGQPLNRLFTELGARFRSEVKTAPRYRLIAGATEPGVVPAAGGASLSGERWTISPAGLEAFAAQLPGSLKLREIELDDGRTALGVHCTDTRTGRDITAFGDWRAYLRYLTATRPMSG